MHQPHDTVDEFTCRRRRRRHSHAPAHVDRPRNSRNRPLRPRAGRDSERADSMGRTPIYRYPELDLLTVCLVVGLGGMSWLQPSFWVGSNLYYVWFVFGIGVGLIPFFV